MPAAIKKGWSRCGFRCAAGNPCCLNSIYDHEYHICTKQECECHTQECYIKVSKSLLPEKKGGEK